MSRIVAVPVHLTALYLKQERAVVEATADVSRLPYTDGQRDVFADTANISESVVSQPFQNENLYLQAGVHLHWALPDALTSSLADPQRLKFPAVPTCWLITRSRNQVVEKQWVVESDYLFPVAAQAQCGGVPYPLHDQSTAQPFRYLGRQLPFDAWLNQPATMQAAYLPELTAVGAGDPSFAAFYPNCRSVFGFHDSDIGDTPPNGTSYELLGWYRLAEQDYFRQFSATLPSASPEELLAAVKQQFQWSYSLGADQSRPQQMICYASLTFAADYQAAAHPHSLQPVTIAVGNTGSEALSAQLAQTIDATHKTTLEDQLEALLLHAQLEHRQLDIGPKFQEGRHAKGFRPVTAGARWGIRPTSAGTAPANAHTAHHAAQVALPMALSEQLNTLNRLQSAYDRALQRIESQREQVFADWYKYMVSAYPPDDARDEYPDIDEIRHFITERGLRVLQTDLRATGRLALASDQSGAVISAAAPDSADDSVAAQLAAAIQATVRQLGAVNQALAQAASASQGSALTYALWRTDAARYWQPADPVVLLSGDAAIPTVRHGQDGRLNPDHLLECLLLGDESVQYPPRAADLAALRAALQQADHHNTIAVTTQREQPWNPFRLEWEVEVFPLEAGSNLQPGRTAYDREFITANYVLAEHQVDLTARQNQGAVLRGANIYAGSAVLTPHAGVHLKRRLEDWLAKARLGAQPLLDAFYQAAATPADQRTIKQLGNQIDALQQWYAAQPGAQLQTPAAAAHDPTYTVIRAYQALRRQPVLSQALGGFHDALLMHKQTLQLPIADPLGFPEYQAFSREVAQAVQRSNRRAPQPLNDFNPIRSGAMRILQLRLVDTFGQVRTLDCRTIVTAHTLTSATSPDLVALPPRIAQPARLNFRWLAAESGAQEMSDHPAGSPICGWLLPNNLDNSLLVYNSAGRQLGTITQQATWQSAPGLEPPLQPQQITNRYLQRLVQYLLRHDAAFIADFISTVDGALAKIEPETFANHQGLALLMGRPLAVARASIGFELQGLAACHQGWNAFRQDLQRASRETDGFTQVTFPIRLGEHRQLNDGLVGYWLESDSGVLQDRFYSPQSNQIGNERIRTHAQGPILLSQPLGAAPQTAMLLVDPRGNVHATSGIVPTKTIAIPPFHYASTLQAMEVTFMARPIITPATTLNLALPDEAGYRWAWVEYDGTNWTTMTAPAASEVQPAAPAETPPRRMISPMVAEAIFVRNQEIREGWLKLSPTDDEAAQ